MTQSSPQKKDCFVQMVHAADRRGVADPIRAALHPNEESVEPVDGGGVRTGSRVLL